MKILGIIPARYASTRFPAKALFDINGKTMVQRVYEQASKCAMLNKVIVATDHELIFEKVKEFNGEVVMTKESHQSGTDRCFEAFEKINEHYDFIVNIQGDEPFIQPAQIENLCKVLDFETQLATQVKRIKDKETLFNVNVPKVIINNKSEAIYFSRQTIPYLRSIPEDEWLNTFVYYKHIGIYAYKSDVLKVITQLPPSSLEKAESLEQLRWIENGFKIKVTETDFESIGIDTPEDLEKAKFFL